MALESVQWLGVAGGLAMVALAAVVAFMDFSNAVHRSFALFLGLRGAMLSGPLYPELGLVENSWGITRYFAIAVPFAAVFFAVRFRERCAGLPVPRWVPWSLLAGAVTCEIAFLADHALYGHPGPPTRFGPLSLLSPLRLSSYAVVAIVVLSALPRLPQAGPRRAAIILGLGFSLNVLVGPARQILGFIENNFRFPDASEPLAVWIEGLLVANGLLMLPIAHALVREQANPGRQATRRAARVALWLLPVPAVLAVAARPLGWDPVVDALSFALLPVFAGYAVVRFSIFDLDRRVQAGIRYGSLASVFVVVFLIATELAFQLPVQEFGPLGWVLGAAGAGALVFALQPLQRWAERISQAAVPAKPIAVLAQGEKEALYQEQAGFALVDGTMTRRERYRLENLRRRLGISEPTARRLEATVGLD